MFLNNDILRVNGLIIQHYVVPEIKNFNIFSYREPIFV